MIGCMPATHAARSALIRGPPVAKVPMAPRCPSAVPMPLPAEAPLNDCAPTSARPRIADIPNVFYMSAIGSSLARRYIPPALRFLSLRYQTPFVAAQQTLEVRS